MIMIFEPVSMSAVLLGTAYLLLEHFYVRPAIMGTRYRVHGRGMSAFVLSRLLRARLLVGCMHSDYVKS